MAAQAVNSARPTESTMAGAGRPDEGARRGRRADHEAEDEERPDDGERHRGRGGDDEQEGDLHGRGRTPLASARSDAAEESNSGR